jgi:hypothetical protein
MIGMRNSLIALSAWMLVLPVQPLGAQDQIRYREFQLGSDVASIVKAIGTGPSDLKVIHRRPAVLQNLEWRPRYFWRGLSPEIDPVELMVFRFVDDQLFTVVVDYAPDRTKGMSDADMIEAVSAAYGLAARPLASPNRMDTMYGGLDAPIAVWGDSESSVTLVRSSYPGSFRLVVALTRLSTLARTASAEADRLDAKEAPQREVARQKKESDEALSALEKAKTANKAVFRP